MAHILIDKHNRCFCNCADKCIIKHKSGMQARCTKEEIEAYGHRPVEVYDDKSHKAIIDLTCNDGSNKKIQIRLKRIKHKSKWPL